MNSYIFVAMAILAAVLIGFETQGQTPFDNSPSPGVLETRPIPDGEMTVPETSTFTYNGCATTAQFGEIMLQFGGKLLSSAETGSGSISIVGFSDGTFGVFLYMPNISMICVLSTGKWPVVGPAV